MQILILHDYRTNTDRTLYDFTDDETNTLERLLSVAIESAVEAETHQEIILMADCVHFPIKEYQSLEVIYGGLRQAMLRDPIKEPSPHDHDTSL